MKLNSIFRGLLVLAASGVALTGALLFSTDSRYPTLTFHAIDTTTHDSSGLYDLQVHDRNIPTIQKNYGGWVNPEDLPPMPQCIAQQDQTAWLNVMTRCTRHRCTNHFIFCTHYQWLIQLSCLSAEFSPVTIRRYVSYCSRSVLAKAQLAEWIQGITGRNWLVEVGDTNELHDLSPRSLTEGYEIFNVERKAPACLRKAPTQFHETFDHVLGSCGFTSTTFHHGNAYRPWEYSTARKSMMALGFDTAGYDLTNRHIPLGEYFDKECFCTYFWTDPQHEPCSDQFELTKERLWLHAICGSSKLPDNWKKSLKIIGDDYISMFSWTKSSDIPDMPPSVADISQQCKTEACGTDSDGFCLVEPAIDRTCVCGKVDYSLCQGRCQSFESKKEYIHWLIKLCGNVEDWHGLPSNWHDLLTPRPRDMIPWQRWNLRPENDKNAYCPSWKTKVGFILLVSLATALAVYFGERCSRSVKTPEYHLKGPAWALRGLVLASVQLVGFWVVLSIIRSTPGYEDVPTLPVMLFLCSLPRLGWLVIRSDFIDLTATWSGLCAEIFLQIPNFYFMATVASYGFRNGFYFGALPKTEEGNSAKVMYGAALFWLAIGTLMSTLIISVLYRNIGTDDLAKLLPSNTARCRYNSHMADWDKTANDGLLSESKCNGSSNIPNYGTMPAADGPSQPPIEPHLKLSTYLLLGMRLLSLVQYVFWIAFIGVSGAE